MLSLSVTNEEPSNNEHFIRRSRFRAARQNGANNAQPLGVEQPIFPANFVRHKPARKSANHTPYQEGRNCQAKYGASQLFLDVFAISRLVDLRDKRFNFTLKIWHFW